jgi:hypothetical protein
MVHATPGRVFVRVILVLVVLRVNLVVQLDDHLMLANFQTLVPLSQLLVWLTVLAVATVFA